VRKREMKTLEKEKEILTLQDEINHLDEQILDVQYSMYGDPNEDDYHEPNPQDPVDILENEKAKKELKLRELIYSIEEDNRKKEVSEQVYKEGYLINDSESMIDFLSRTEHAQGLSKFISSKKTLSPLTIGIFGKWGEGKSSFLNLISDELEKINVNRKNDKNIQSGYNKTHIVRFDASEYDDQDRIWYSMLSQLFAKYEEERKFTSKIRYGYGMLIKTFKENMSSFAINLIIIITFSLWVYFNSKGKTVMELLSDNSYLTNIIGIISTIAVASNIIIPSLKKVKFLTKPLSEKVMTQLKYPDYKDLLGTREKVKESLDMLVNVWVKNSGDKIVIMVDELDRCSRKTIVEFFDALQLFLPVKSLIYVISINQEAISFALASNNTHFFEQEVISNKEKLEFGKEYLEKYITVPYHLPTETNYEDYIIQLLKENPNEYIISHNEKENLIKVISDISSIKHITPREIKKIINLLLLSNERIINYNKYKDINFTLKFEEYITWFLIRYFFPETATFIARYFGINYKKGNKYKTFGQIYTSYSFEIELKEEITRYPQISNSTILFKYIDNTRIEYISFYNRIAKNLII
jgi:hypothetical protein